MMPRFAEFLILFLSAVVLNVLSAILAAAESDPDASTHGRR